MSRSRGGLLGLIMAGAIVLLPGFGRAQIRIGPPANPAVIVLVDGASLPQLLGIPEVRALARGGGAALLVPSSPTGAFLRGAVSPAGPLAAAHTKLVGPVTLGDLEATLRRVAGPQPEGLVAVIGNQPSAEMLSMKDELLPIALGPPRFTGSGPLRTLTSDTTRRTGVVSTDDIVPTILAWQGRSVPSSALGSPMRVVDAPPPLHLYEKHLANRQMSVPIQTGAAIYVGLAGLLGVAVLYFRRRAPRWLKLVAARAAMSVPALAVALLAAGRLPTLSYGTVVPFLVVGAAAGTVAFQPLRRGGVLLMPTAIGAAVLLYFVVEAIFNWSAALTPFLGGSELDGGRFFGLPNVYVGLLVGVSLYIAQRLALTPGVGLIVAVGFFAGLPGIGANLGGALTLFSAAGLWLIVRAHDRLGWGKTIAIAAAIVVVGMGAVFASHVFLTATPTHGTRFVEGAGRSASGIWDTVTHRLGVGFDLIARNPFALLPVLGVPACLYVALRPPPSIGGAFERHPVWRDAMLVILLTSVVAYAVNDSGAAAVGLGFGLAIGGMLYVPLSEEAGNMEAA